MLGKERMARLRSIAKLHNLATGSQTIPNSVAEAAAAQGKSPQIGPSTTVALPTPERKKLPPKRAKRKTPRVVSDEEEDESTEDGLVCKRKRATVAEPPTAEGTSPNYAKKPPSASKPFESAGDVLPSNASAAGATQEQLADTQASPQLAAKLPASPPRHEIPLAIQSCEGGGENRPSIPPPTLALPAPLQEALKSFTAHLNAMVVENLPQVVGEALKDSLIKFETDNRIHQEEASTARGEAGKLKCDMLMQGLEFSRVENALNDELQSLRNDKAELRQKLHAKLQEVVELESKLVPMRAKIAELEEAQKTGEAKMAKLEKRSTERETLLGKVEANRDKKSKELSETTVELAQVREENSGLKKKINELELEAAQVLTSGFGAALEQFACEFPDIDLSKFSVYNEVVDGKIMPST